MKREFIFLLSVVVVLTAAVGVLAGYVFFGERGGARLPGTASQGPIEEGGPELPPRGLRLAEGWKCMCGSCTDDLLDCHCDDPNGAHQIKGELRDYLAAGVDDEAVRDEMIKRYGPGILGSQLQAPSPPAQGGGATGEPAPEETGA